MASRKVRYFENPDEGTDDSYSGISTVLDKAKEDFDFVEVPKKDATVETLSEKDLR